MANLKQDVKILNENPVLKRGIELFGHMTIAELFEYFVENTKKEASADNDAILARSKSDREAYLNLGKQYYAKAKQSQELLLNCYKTLLKNTEDELWKLGLSNEELLEILCPKIVNISLQPVFTKEQVEFLSYYFWLIPREEDTWEPTIKHLLTPERPIFSRKPEVDSLGE